MDQGFTHDSNFISKFQILDMLTLQTTTISTDNPFLCNGANLAYNKKVFLNLNAFKTMIMLQGR